MNYIAASILFILIVSAGLILLVIPGVVWGLKFSLFHFFIVDKGMGPIDALKASSQTTNGAKWDALGLFYATYIIMYAGVLCLLIGVFAALPIALLAWTLAYRRLDEQTSRSAPRAALYSSGA